MNVRMIYGGQFPPIDLFIPDVMRCWKHGLDTKAMSIKFMVPEHYVALCLRIGRDREYAQKDWNDHERTAS